MNRLGVVLAGCLAAGVLVGCSGGPPAATVTGEVKVDGLPVAKGFIAFAPSEGPGGPSTAEIKNGRYEIQTTAGKKRVQISVPVVTGKRKESNAPDAALIEITAESLPDRYHAKSELTLDVKSGSNTKDWALSAKPQ